MIRFWKMMNTTLTGFGWLSADEGWPPLPYPASCRPPAWAAVSAWVLADVLGDE